MTKIVFLDRKSIGPSVDLKRPQFPHEWEEYEKTAPGEVVERARDAEIIITNKVPIDTDCLSQLPKLRMIAVAATGYDIIDVPACDGANVAVANVRGYAAQTVPEHVMALMLALSRSLAAYRADVIDGEWQRAGQFTFFAHPIRDLADQTLGIIGAGAIGDSVARLAGAFGMRVLVAGRKGEDNPREGRTPFGQVIRESDVITLHCPLTPETRNLIAAPELAAMERKPIIINTARGGLVNEADLAAALAAGQVRAIGFDTLTKEPPEPDNPLMQIAGQPNVIITPHAAWASDTAMQTLWDQVIANIEAFQRNGAANIVSPA